MKYVTTGLVVALIGAFGIGCFQVGMMYNELLGYRLKNTTMFSAAQAMSDERENHAQTSGKKKLTGS